MLYIHYISKVKKEKKRNIMGKMCQKGASDSEC